MNLSRFSISAIIAAASFAAALDVWTGEGESPSWNDGGNWEGGKAVSPSLSALFVFDSPKPSAFAFGGTAPFTFASISMTSNSGPVSIKAPGIVLGADANSEPDVAYVMERLSHGARIENASTNDFTFRGPVALKSTLEVVAPTNGAVVFEGGVTGSNCNIKVSGPGGVVFRGGELNVGRIERTGAAVTFDGVSRSTPDYNYGDKTIPTRFVNGAKLEYTGHSESLRILGMLELGNSAELVGPGDRSVYFSDQAAAPVFGENVSISNFASVCFAPIHTASNRVEYSFPAGARIHARNNVWVGGAPADGDWRRLNPPQDILVEFRGQEVKPGAIQAQPENDPSISYINAAGTIGVGGVLDRWVSSDVTLRASGGVMFRAGGTFTVGKDGGVNNSVAFKDGVRVFAKQLVVGNGSWSNRFAAAACNIHIGEEGVLVGANSQPWAWSCPRGDKLILDNGSRLVSEGSLIVGRGRCEQKNLSPTVDNAVSVAGGSRLKTKGAVVGSGGPWSVATNCTVGVVGKGSCWDLDGGSIVLGETANGWASGNAIFVRNGAMVTNVKDVVIGAGGNSGPTTGNRFTVNGGAVFSTGMVRVGRTGKSNQSIAANGNTVSVGGMQKGPTALWHFGGGELRVGADPDWGQNVKENEFHVRSGARLSALKSIVIGKNKDGFVAKDNTFALEGGTVDPIETLEIAEENTLATAIGPSVDPKFVKPLQVKGNLTFGKNARIKPLAGAGIRPGRYPVIMWKDGVCKGADGLKLAPGVDEKRWKLSVDEEKKWIVVEYSN